MHQLKEAFVEMIQQLIGPEEAEHFFYSIQNPQLRRSIRVNTLKCSKASLKKWLKSQGYEVQDNPFSKDVLDITGKGQPLALKLPYHAGFTYPQDSSSTFAVELLDPQPGEWALDLTAAPGGKCSQIAARMKNRGVLVANDLDSRRLKALHSNMERLGVWNAVVFRAMPHKLLDFYGEVFDRILLDPSCSGEGLLVTRDAKPGFWSPKALKRYSAEQYGLLRSAFKLLKPGGRLVYSTCTLNAVENDGVVQRLLDDFPEAEIVMDAPALKAAPEQIPGFGGKKLLGIRFWPQKTQTKGFFCIAITKTAALGREPEKRAEHRVEAAKEKGARLWTQYLEKEFGIEIPDVFWTYRDEVAFITSPELADFPLPPAYSLTFPLLKIFSQEIRPTHGGALYLALHAKKNRLEFDRAQTEKLFEHQQIPLSKKVVDGSYLAAFQEFPLGFAKIHDQEMFFNLPKQH